MIVRPPPVKIWRPRNIREREAADRAMAFFTTYLRHTKGVWARQPFNVLGWQEHQVIRPLYGRLRPDGTRQFRSVWIEVGKKQGKSELAAGLGLKGLFADDEPMAEVYIGAVDRDQAGIIYQTAARMVRMDPELSKRARPIDSTKRIVVTSGGQAGSFLAALASDADSADGTSPSTLIFDEVHRYKRRDFYDTLIRSTAARRQPIVIRLTTAGTDHESLGWNEHEYARQVIEGIIEDPELLAVIYAAAADANFRDPRAWAAANPSIGQTVQVSYYEAEARKAAEDPASENSFRRFHLNQWVAQATRWMPMDLWDAAAGHVEAARLRDEGVICWAGLDLSQTRDLTAFVMIFAPEDEESPFQVVARFWIPEDNVQIAMRRDRVPYDRWIADGWIRTTPGNTIDYETIRKDVRADAAIFPIQDIAFDPAFAWQLAQQLSAAGLQMVPFRQGFLSMGHPTADLLQLVKDRRFEHGANPVLRWMADGVVVEQDALGNWRPSKAKSTQRIDGVVAAIMGLDRAERSLYGPRDDEGVMVYEDRVTIGPSF